VSRVSDVDSAAYDASGMTRRARELSTAPYDRQVLTEHLVEQMRGWRFARRYDDSRMLSAVHATFDVLDDLDGASLADRKARFEQDLWPRWQNGQDRIPIGARWDSASGRW
jgi:hypothetical protein